MTPVSSPIWQILPALQKVQFPWRVAVMLDVATAMLVAAGVHCILNSRSIWRWSGVLAALLLLSSTYLMENKSRAFLFDKLRPANLRVENAWVLKYHSSFHSVQSLPRWAPRISLRDETELARLQEQPLVSDNNGTSEIQAAERRVNEIQFNTRFSESTVVTVRQFYYPLWKVELGNGQRISTSPSPNGLLQFVVPSGNQSVRVFLGSLLQEMVGLWLAGLSLIILVLIQWWHRRLWSPTPAAPEKGQSMLP